MNDVVGILRFPGPSAAVDALLDLVRGVVRDVRVIGADANYWSVSEELAVHLAEASSSGCGVIAVRHTEWPTARRDHYCDPTSLPAHAVHPFTTAFGVRPGRPEPVRDGIRGPRGSAWAIREGGPANGVRTAVEDRCAAKGGLEVRFVPVGTGVAIVWSADSPHSAAMAAMLDILAQHPVADSLRDDRLAQIDAALELQAQLSEQGDAGPRLRGENARLRARTDTLLQACATIEREAEILGYSAVLRVLDVAERAARRRRPGSTFRDRLLRMRDAAARARGDA